MDLVVYVAAAVAVAGLVLGFWKRVSYTMLLLFTCTAVFILTALTTGYGYYYTYSPVQLDLSLRAIYLTQGSNLYTLYTNMFVHADVVHLLVNMMFLFLIGMQLEERVGKRRFAIFYFVPGVIGGLLECFLLGGSSTVLILGASGAISGVMGAMLFLYPRDEIPMFIGPLFLPRVSVILSVGSWFAIQVVMVFLGGSNAFAGGGVAYGAHIGGFVAGLFLAAALPKPAGREKIKADAAELAVLATTPKLQADLERIQGEEEPAVRKAWLEHFAKEAKCPLCGSKLKAGGNSIGCTECSFQVKVR
jgi:membrane associated rhomboid family serine protease